MDDYRFDLAISFLQEDEPIALEIADRIGERLAVDVFVYSKRQDDLAGRDGLEEFSGIFGFQSRVVAVLHRKGWGDTTWTRVEETAIKNRAFENGFDFLLLVRLDGSPIPKWVPNTKIWLGFEKYGIDGAAATIESMVQQSGGEVRSKSAVDYAGRVSRAINFERERENWHRSTRGIDDAIAAANQAIGEMGRLGKRIQDELPSLELAVEQDRDSCVIGNSEYSVVIGWIRGTVVNSLSESYFFAKLFRGYVGRGLRLDRPELIDVVRYDPDVDRTLSAVWRDRETEPPKFLTSNQMADFWLRRLLDLINPNTR